MPPPSFRPPLEAIRVAAAAAVEADSLRSVARQVGMSATGLRNFIRGERRPYPGTLKKLNAWYVRHNTGRGGTSAQLAAAAVAVLLGDLPEEEHEAAAAPVLAALAGVYRARRVKLPPWLEPYLKEE